MNVRFTALAVAGLVAAAFTSSADAAGGRYTIDGGSRAEQAQVSLALDASSFNWDVVPGVVAVHIARGVDSSASRGQIWLDADLLDAGRFAWGVVQHEYAHQVDFLALTEQMRDQLRPSLGGASWWGDGTTAHGALTSERLADEIAWAYWTSADNCLRPANAADEGGQVPPQQFRTLLASILPGVQGPERALLVYRRRR
jgi:hypothetical protein